MTPSSPKRKYPLIFGVINLTPDSFSDGGRYLNPQTCQQTLEQWSSQSDLVPDFGAESTAPMNQSISFEAEKTRWMNFFSQHAQQLKKFSLLSFDTYKAESMQLICDQLQLLGYSGKIIWNDVSGQFDQAAEQLLSDHPQLSWVLCHTLVPERSLSSQHKNYAHQLTPQTVLSEMIQWFEQKLALIPADYHDRLICDPCFGFSKDVATNQLLCEQIEQVIEALGKELPWLLGISKKSFLQAQLTEQGFVKTDPYFHEQLEGLHQKWLAKWLRSPYSDRLSYRVHQPEVVRSALFAGITPPHF